MVQRPINGTGPGAFLTPAYAAANYRADLLRPYLGYGSLTSIETSGDSSYNAMLLRLSRRFSNSFAFNVNYTLSRAYDIVDNDSDGSGGGTNGFVDPRNPGLNWAPAGFDATHSLTIDYLFELPHVNGSRALRALLNGWQISGITHYQTGFPISVISNGDLKGADAGSAYANVAGDPYAGQTKYRWLNPNAFQRPPDGQYGNGERHSLRGQGYGNFDATLSRNIRLAEEVNFKIQMDVFNLFNHPQVLGINTGWASDNAGGGPNQSTLGNFGTITSYRPARILQFGFKLSF
jgi:hypothetical protein